MAPLTRSEARLLGQTDFLKPGKSKRNRGRRKAKRKGKIQAVKQEDRASSTTIKTEPTNTSLFTSTTSPVLDSVWPSIPNPTTHVLPEGHNPTLSVQALVTIGGTFKASKFYDQLYLLGKRLLRPGAPTWTLPGGPIHAGQDVVRAAIDYVRTQTGFYVEAADLGTHFGSVLRRVKTTSINAEGVEEEVVTAFVVCNWDMGKVSVAQRDGSPFLKSSLVFRRWDEICECKPLDEPLRALDRKMEMAGCDDGEESEGSGGGGGSDGSEDVENWD